MSKIDIWTANFTGWRELIDVAKAYNLSVSCDKFPEMNYTEWKYFSGEFDFGVACFLVTTDLMTKYVHGSGDRSRDGNLDNLYLNLLGRGKRIVIIPSMSYYAWISQPVQRNVESLKRDGVEVVDIAMYEKDLIPKNTGSIGRRALEFEIIAACDISRFLFDYIPMPPHPGAFGVKRRHHYHTGVDLYVHRNNAIVYPFEDGVVVSQGYFTGAPCGSPWWNTTSYIAIRSGEYVIVYGEIEPSSNIQIGQAVTTKTPLGKVIPVTKNRHPEFEYHNNKMLHVELHKAHGFEDASVSEWEINKKRPDVLLDPTDYVKQHKVTTNKD